MTQNLIVFKSIFILNVAGDFGGGVCIDKSIMTMKVLISQNFFQSNEAFRKKNLLNFSIYLFSVGGALAFLFFKGDSEIKIWNNLFERNNADFAGVIFANNPSGTIFTFNNSFLMNFAFTKSNLLLGSGGVFNLGGTANTCLVSYKDNYFKNIAEFKGFDLKNCSNFLIFRRYHCCPFRLIFCDKI